MKTIPLTQGFVTLVDDRDYSCVSAYNWCANRKRKRVYAVRRAKRANGSWGTIYLHQFLLPGVKRVDHRDGDGLNNRRSNLRPATNRQNLQGTRSKIAGTSSRFRGVSWSARFGFWRATITAGGKHLFLGNFEKERDAALAYDRAARQHFGEFASPNFPK